MKGLLLSILLGVFATACSEKGGSVIGEKTTIETQSTIEIGKVAKGEVIEAKVNIKNTGDYPLMIADIKGSCTCTVTEKPKDPVAPGETVSTIAKIDTKDMRAGNLTKSVTITTNTVPSTTKVVIKAEIIN